MSHFSVLVIGPDHDKQLAPYHEFECTGIDDEFVQDVDVTDEARASFSNDTVTRYRDPEGALYKPYADRFYREMTPDERKNVNPVASAGAGHGISWTSKDWGDGHGYRPKAHFLPEGWTETQVPQTDLADFRNWVQDYYDFKPLLAGAKRAEEHQYGYVEINNAGDVVRVIRRTNPDKKWDGYQIGGRYTGSLKLKEKTSGVIGRPGLLTERAAPGYADQALKGDVDFEQMRNDQGVKARALWKLTREITGGSSWESWDDTCTRYPDIKIAREEYHNQPALEMLRASGRDMFQWNLDDNLALDEEIYVQRERDAAVVNFAFVKDGTWYERGTMGWFATVSNGMSKAQWNSKFNQMLNTLSDDTLLTVIDCHI